MSGPPGVPLSEEHKEKISRAKQVEIDEKHLARLCHIQCTLKEMAAEFGCHPDTLSDRYSDFIRREKERGKEELRAYQWYLMKHHKSIAMAQWLGKEYLGQGKDNDNLIDLTPIEQLNANLEMIQKKEMPTQDQPELAANESLVPHQ
jgi:hypothetical protein